MDAAAYAQPGDGAIRGAQDVDESIVIRIIQADQLILGIQGDAHGFGARLGGESGVRKSL